MLTRILQSIALTLIVLQCSCARHEQAVAQRQLAERARSTLGISIPCTVSCDDNGRGLTEGALVGAHKDTLRWSWDGLEGRRQVPKPHDGESDARYQARVDSFLAYPPHLVHVNGRALPLNSPAESVFIAVLWSAIGKDTVWQPLNHDSLVLEGMRYQLGRPTTGYLSRLNNGPRAARVARALQRQQRGMPAVLTSAEVESLKLMKR